MIVHRTTDRAAEMAKAHRVRSCDLLRNGIVDRIIPEYPDDADEPADFGRRTAALEEELNHLPDADGPSRGSQPAATATGCSISPDLTDLETEIQIVAWTLVRRCVRSQASLSSR